MASVGSGFSEITKRLAKGVRAGVDTYAKATGGEDNGGGVGGAGRKVGKKVASMFRKRAGSRSKSTGDVSTKTGSGKTLDI